MDPKVKILKEYLKEYIRGLLKEIDIETNDPNQQPPQQNNPQPNPQPQQQNQGLPQIDPKTFQSQLKTGDPNERFGYVSIDQAAALIRGTKGKVFTCIFKKKDGSMRTMNARLGVKAYLHGGTLPYDPNSKGLIPVFDMQKREYRMINIDGIQEVKINQFIFKVK